MSGLEGCVALVTGCAGGIGSAICTSLSDAGAVVIGADIGGADFDGWRQQHPECELATLDVTDEAAWQMLAETIRSKHGRLDVLVHNAGVVLVKTLAETEPDDWRRLMAVNVDALYLGTRATLSLLTSGGERRKSGASLIVISSTAGFIGAPMHVGYCTSKGAARLFATACAIEFPALGLNIRSNSVHPGGVETPMLDHIVERFAEARLASSVESVREAFIGDVPLKRLATPDDIAGVVRFLASDEAAYMHGSEIKVDGGYLAR